ncbi:hypothetical protein [Trabulsiella odontotermitis]|uniref:hypothetical protein n=1 Tax=Trabulsiella odontotermitis TaxID=379893 RepID=UPI000A6715C7|nr:hypothetical protein [Trabulsiella odontotermitis]
MTSMIVLIGFYGVFREHDSLAMGSFEKGEQRQTQWLLLYLYENHEHIISSQNVLIPKM